MKIYLIKHDQIHYDGFMQHVIIANSEQEVREIAKNQCANERTEVWNTAIVDEVSAYSGKNTKPFILLSNFNAG